MATDDTAANDMAADDTANRPRTMAVTGSVATDQLPIFCAEFMTGAGAAALADLDHVEVS
ncbi:hypothetical protein ACIRO1_44195 [Streptomyces sp. NPDC102381]|uniref:hypothetical protein n=1 Tax=Streptomyces sp. NPDC102381 TaxID=3366164 RepID=UPI00382A098E